MKILGFAIGFLTTLAITVSATVRYVDVNSASPTPPYTNWATASTNIQVAIDASGAGDKILVTNGVYQTGGRAIDGILTNRVAINKAVTVQSVNGPTVTVIQGYQMPGTKNGNQAVRCVYMTNNAALIGFTLANGATRSAGDVTTAGFGGGLWCISTNATVSNCLLSNNSALLAGGGAFRGTLTSCVLMSNSVPMGVGPYTGGGAYASELNNCTLTGNAATDGGGAYFCTLRNCTISGNLARDGGGAHSSFLTNCLVLANSGAIGAGTYGGTLNNCTVIANSATVSEGGAISSTLRNCIIYYNTAPSNPNYSSGTLNYCCTTPLPTNGFGNITNDPVFLDLATGDFHLQLNSPCINAGNNAYAPAGSDLDGNPRIVGGTVDIGAYEFQSPASMISYAWLQQYGIAANDSSDSGDMDTDGMNNWQEWRADTNPTNSQSLLRVSSPSNGLSGILVQWQSTNTRTYFLERANDLGSQPPFSNVASNIIGQVGTTSYTDTNAIGNGPFFYRVGVQE